MIDKTNKYRCLIIDDDPLICDLLKHFCSKIDWVSTCISVGDGKQAMQALSNDQFDLILLDYNLPDLKGKQLLEIFPEALPVIMVTSELTFGAASYEYEQIIDFIVKPLKFERFLKAMSRFHNLNNVNQTVVQADQSINKTLLVKEGNSTVILKVENIKYVKSESNYVVFFMDDRKVMSLMSLKQLEQDLPAYFVRVQKSYIANLHFVDEIRTDELIISNQQIPIGQKHKAQLKERLKAWNDANH